MVPDPFVNPRLVVEAFVAKKVVPVALVKMMPVEETTPALVTRNLVDEFTWKFTKSPP